jgi:lipid-A-disaccharide synthase
VGALTFFLIAGEPSGDKLGAALMVGLRELTPEVRFVGVGGPLMAAQGMDSLFPMQELSIMGIVEVLPKYFHFKRRIRETARAAIQAGPAALITIDSPDFCLRVAALVKAARPAQKTVHYVAPSVWAWRPGRAVKMARFIDHVLALLPFEPPYMTKAGMDCDFVGHPVVAEALASLDDKSLLDPPGRPLILALPGSRRGEIARLAPVFGQTLALLKDRIPGASVIVPTLPHLLDLVHAATADWPIAPLIITDPALKRAAFAIADVALAASGTVSLELAANDCPMVIAYDVSPLSRWLMTKLARIDTVTLVNLVSETRTVPEFIGKACVPDKIAAAILAVLADSGAQHHAMALTMDRLGRGDESPGLRAARSVLASIGQAS